MDCRCGSHTVFQIEYDFVWVKKYRYKVLSGEVAVQVRELVRRVQDGVAMTRRSGDAYPDFQSASHQPTGFSRWSLSSSACRSGRRWPVLANRSQG